LQETLVDGNRPRIQIFDLKLYYYRVSHWKSN
jgi:hypothetical protein